MKSNRTACDVCHGGQGVQLLGSRHPRHERQVDHVAGDVPQRRKQLLCAVHIPKPHQPWYGPHGPNGHGPNGSNWRLSSSRLDPKCTRKQSAECWPQGVCVPCSICTSSSSGSLTLKMMSACFSTSTEDSATCTPPCLEHGFEGTGTLSVVFYSSTVLQFYNIPFSVLQFRRSET